MRYYVTLGKAVLAESNDIHTADRIAAQFGAIVRVTPPPTSPPEPPRITHNRRKPSFPPPFVRFLIAELNTASSLFVLILINLALMLDLLHR